MIRRDLTEDFKHAQLLSELPTTRNELKKSPMIWHFLLLPRVGGIERFVATGHINCHDCVLCQEQGVQWSEAPPVPWRSQYNDCCDDDEDVEHDFTVDELAWALDAVRGGTPGWGEDRSLCHALDKLAGSPTYTPGTEPSAERLDAITVHYGCFPHEAAEQAGLWPLPPVSSNGGGPP